MFTYSSQHFSNVSEWKLMTNFSGQIMCNCNENLSQLETDHDWLLNVAGQPIRGTISNSPMFPKHLHMIQPLLHVNYVLLIIYFIDGRSLIRGAFAVSRYLNETFPWRNCCIMAFVGKLSIESLCYSSSHLVWYTFPLLRNAQEKILYEILWNVKNHLYLLWMM